MSKIRVHWNIHKGGLVVRGCPNVPGDMEYVDAVCVKNARFVVSEKTRDRVRVEGVRTVHAWVEGERCDCGATDGVDVTYNPFRDNGFVIRGSETVVKTAAHVALRAHGVGKTARHETRAKI